MAKQKRNTLTYQQQQIINADKDYDVLHPETDSKVVIYDNSESGLNATNAQDAIDELKTEIDGKSSSIATAPDYEDFFKEDKNPKNSGTAFSKDALVGDIKDNSTSDNLTSAKQVTDYVDNKVAGKINYYGTVDSLAEVFVKMADATEGDMVRVTTEFAVGTDIAHVGDIIIAKSDKPTTVDGIKVAHTEIDTNTWTANSKTANGYVAKGEGNPGKFWGTDSEGNPGWMYIKPDITNACKTQIKEDEDDYYMAYESGIGNPYLYIQDFDDPNTYHYSGLLVSHYTYKDEEIYLYIGNDRVMTGRTDVSGWYDPDPTDMKYYFFKYNDSRQQWEVFRNSSPETVARKVANEITEAKLDDFKGTPAEGTYSVVRTNSNGVVQAGGNLIEVGADTTSEPSANLVVGGIFFKPIEISE